MQEQKQSAELSFDAPSLTDLNALDFHLKIQKGQVKEKQPIKEEKNESGSGSGGGGVGFESGSGSGSGSGNAVFGSASSGESNGKISDKNPHGKVDSPHEQ